jgi:hypothetical protein
MPSDSGNNGSNVPSRPPGPAVAIFVMGTAHNGAEALAGRLGGHPRLCRVPRTRLLVDFEAAVARNQGALTAYGLPEQYWRQALSGFIGGLQREHAAAAGKVRWVEYISSSSLSIPQVDRIFPVAQFVHVIAQARGGAGRLLSVNRRAGASLLASRYLEVSDEDVVARPGEILTLVLNFLGESLETAGPEVSLEDRDVVVDLDVHRPAAQSGLTRRR